MENYDVVVIGAGAAGMMCAIEAGKRGRKVALLDHAKKIGIKILISGGGRCNFTNTDVSPEAYVSANPHFCKSALARFTPADFIAMVQAHNIPFHEKKLGQLFCDESAKNIVELLISECQSAGAVFYLQTQIQSVRKESDHFLVETNRGVFQAASVVVATGGLSVPKAGVSGLGYQIARDFSLHVMPTSPALDGFRFDKALRKYADRLAGVSVDALVTCNGVSFRENILFTHLGLSGPAALQASLYWTPGSAVIVDLAPDLDLAAWIRNKRRAGAKAELKNLLAEVLPKRLAERFGEIYLSNTPALAQMADKDIDAFSQNVKQWTLMPIGTVGYEKAEVTRGGVSSDELSSKTMEAKKVPGLFFIGEVVDVTGRLGGFNFQWAWASGWVAGQNA